MIDQILKRLGALERKASKISPPFILASISTIATGKVTLIIEGESGDTGQEYSYLNSYTPSINDRVLCARISGTLTVIGKVG